MGDESAANIRPQVMPVRIAFLYQPQFPGAIPFLESFLAGDGGFHREVVLVVNKNMYAIAFREAFGQVVLVFPDALGEVRGDADIERPVTAAGCRASMPLLPPCV